MTLNNNYYDMIFKRKSFHLFENIGEEKLTEEELQEIYDSYQTLVPLDTSIQTKIKIVPAEQTTCKRGNEYSILMYSEVKDGYLQNIGYLGEQLDLYLVSKNIGTLWYGLGKTEEKEVDGLSFVIMFGIAKVDELSKFRKDMFKSKRKPLEEIWNGDLIEGVSEIVRFSPSACNSQPWYVEHEGNVLNVYRNLFKEKVGLMVPKVSNIYNQMDMGIFLCFLELCLNHENIKYERVLNPTNVESCDRILTARYKLK